MDGALNKRRRWRRRRRVGAIRYLIVVSFKAITKVNLLLDDKVDLCTHT